MFLDNNHACMPAAAAFTDRNSLSYTTNLFSTKYIYALVLENKQEWLKALEKIY